MEFDKNGRRRFNRKRKGYVNYRMEVDEDLFDLDFLDDESDTENIVDNGNEIVVYFDMPGLNKGDISLNIEENRIEINADKKEAIIDDKDPYFYEAIYSGFYRVVTLPVKIVPEKTTVSYENEILEIIAPKLEIHNKNQSHK
jgi:HSP20 family molecular chaperone IbpA